MIVYKVDETIDKWCLEKQWLQQLRRITLRKKAMNEFNNKLVLQEVLKRLGASDEFAKNDVVINTIASIFDSIIVRDYNDMEYNYVNNMHQEDELVTFDEEKIKKRFEDLIDSNYKMLKDKVFIENSDGECSLKICSFHFRRYTNELLYAASRQDCNSMFEQYYAKRDLWKINFLEISQDKKKKNVILKNKNFNLYHHKMDEYTQNVLAHIDTLIGVYDKSSKMIKFVELYDRKKIQFENIIEEDELSYNKKLEIVVEDGMINSKLEIYPESSEYGLINPEGMITDNPEPEIFTLTNIGVCYEKGYTDYIEWQQHELDDEAQKLSYNFFLKNKKIINNPSLSSLEQINSATEKYVDILGDKQIEFYQSLGFKPENYLLNADYTKFMGILYRIDKNLIEDIKNKLNKQKRIKIKQRHF